MRRSLPTQERLRALFSYQDGQLFWKTGSGKAMAGDPVGHLTRQGYIKTGLDYAEYQVHRLVWKWHYGTEPDVLDHVNGIRHDNRIENLEPVTNRENINRGFDRRSELPRGVRKVREKYQARIYADGKRLYLGLYGTIEEAAAAYNDALRKAARVDCRDN
jgi:hypothetical protein